MPPKSFALSKAAIKSIHLAVEKLYDKLKGRFLGPQLFPKSISINFNPTFSLPGVFKQASMEERKNPSMDTLHLLLKIAEGYLDAHKSVTQSRVVNAVQAFLSEAHLKGVKTDVETVLGGELADIWRGATNGVKKIVEVETHKAQNIGTLEGITSVATSLGDKDPVVYFSCPPVDDKICDLCLRLHFMPDQVTPRVWLLSELKHGYAKKDDLVPSSLGEHPGCRGLLSYLPSKNYGFQDGRATFISYDHDEFDKQRNSIEKSEKSFHSNCRHETFWSPKEDLIKSTPEGIHIYNEMKETYDRNAENFDWEKHGTGERNLDFEKQISQAPIAVQMPNNIFHDLIHEGRLKNRFETNRTMGDPSVKARKDYEFKSLGINSDIPPHKRPIYGALHWRSPVNEEWKRGAAPAYGDTFMILKPHVKERSTFTPGDSFEFGHWNYTYPHHALHKMAHQSFHKSYKPHLFGYLESQIHGGVDLSKDVDSIHIGSESEGLGGDNSDSAFNHVVNVGKKYGLPVWRHYEGDESKLLYSPPQSKSSKMQPNLKPDSTKPIAP